MFTWGREKCDGIIALLRFLGPQARGALTAGLGTWSQPSILGASHPHHILCGFSDPVQHCAGEGARPGVPWPLHFLSVASRTAPKMSTSQPLQPVNMVPYMAQGTLQTNVAKDPETGGYPG